MPTKLIPQQIRFLGTALLWGMVEFLALRRARRQDGRRAGVQTRRRVLRPGG
jgi:hypothetical protein